MALINETLFKSANGKTKPGRAVPLGRKRVAYRKMLTGLLYLGTYVVLGGQYNYSIALDASFTSMGLFRRYVDGQRDDR